ncbi:hypothetical protein [Tranquillimonas alkanivorans]|uniref:hypothetical protein n=1 Tax=Tranquillimonas alkanivorans TaxID=441119 RepID=UPI000B838A27|nr:hypothetical protein [Tranquillimonas alkanivorans]
MKVTPELQVDSLRPFMEAGFAFEAKQVITAPYDPDLARLAGKLAAIADLAAEHDLGTVLEFFP